MQDFFPASIRFLPEADIPLEGIKAYLSQAENHQIIFMQFDEDVVLPKHSHSAQISFVLEGRIDLEIGEVHHTFSKGDIISIPEGIEHSGIIYGGYADITFFNERNRYSPK